MLVFFSCFKIPCFFKGMKLTLSCSFKTIKSTSFQYRIICLLSSHIASSKVNLSFSCNIDMVKNKLQVLLKGGSCPSRQLSELENRAVRKIITKWVGKMSFQNACLHFEARCRPQSLYKDTPIFDENQNVIEESYFLMPIEINLRLGGAETWSMIRSVYDINLLEEHLKICLGIRLNDRELNFKFENPRFRCISNDIHPARNVILKSIKINTQKLRADSRAIELSIFRSPGDILTIKDYVGWITVKNRVDSSDEELAVSLNQIMSYIQFEYENC
jgi:hypothetical protein